MERYIYSVYYGREKFGRHARTVCLSTVLYICVLYERHFSPSTERGERERSGGDKIGFFFSSLVIIIIEPIFVELIEPYIYMSGCDGDNMIKVTFFGRNFTILTFLDSFESKLNNFFFVNKRED